MLTKLLYVMNTPSSQFYKVRLSPCYSGER